MSGEVLRTIDEEEQKPLLRNNSNNNYNDIEHAGGRQQQKSYSFQTLNEDIKRDSMVQSVSQADRLSDTLESAHKLASESDDAGEAILKSLNGQRNRLLSARAAANSMERDIESSERKLRRMGYEKCIQKWMWHIVALCFVSAIGTLFYWKVTSSGADHEKNGRHLSDYKILDVDDDGNFQ